MVFQVILNTVLNPKKIINSDLCEKYNFIHMWIIIGIWRLIISILNIRINFFNDVILGTEFYLVVFSAFISLVQTEILIFILYSVNKMFHAKKIKLYTFNRYIIPFYETYSFIKNIFLLIFMIVGIYNNILRLILVLCFRICMCYPIYLFLKKYKLSQNIIIILLVVYIFITLTNFV